MNGLASLTGGRSLTCAQIDSWPGGGIAGGIQFGTVTEEANWAVNFARTVLGYAPTQRIGIISRTAPRRRFVDAVAVSSGLPTHRWDDGVLDTDTAQIIKVMLVRLNLDDLRGTPNPLVFLREAAGLSDIADPDTRRNVADAVTWCLDRIREGLNTQQIRARILVGNDSTLLSAPGIHLLSGHVGKGQQFDWVVVVGAEDGVVPDFRAKTNDELVEEVRILSVMISRARHGVVVTCAGQVPAANGKVWPRTASRYYSSLRTARFTDGHGIATFLEQVDWEAVAAR